MTNEEMCLEALELCKKTRIFIPANEYLDTAINSIEENTKLKAEINRLIGKSGMYRDMADSFCESNKKLKAEIEQLLELLKSSCVFCHYERHHGNEEPCRSCKTYGNWKLKGRVEE